MPNIIGEPFRKYVRKQITQRQKAHGSGVNQNRTPEQLTYLNSKTAWVKLASGIKIGSKFPSEPGIKASSWATLAKQYVLFSGLSNLKDGKLNPRTNVYNGGKGVYDVNTMGNNSSEFGMVPMPGITSVEVKCENRGSIKKATVNFKCYSPEQFRILDILYLRIGYTMFLEWGWSSYLNNETGNLVSDYSTLIEDPNGFFNDKWKKTTYIGFLPQIEQQRIQKNGNYDGLLCKVQNFSWTFSQDGSYDIQLNLISLGDVVESLSCNVTPPTKVSDFINVAYKIFNDETEDSEEEGTAASKTPPGPVSNFLSSYFFIQKLYLINEVNDGYWETNDCPSTFGTDGTLLPVRSKYIKKPPKDDPIEVTKYNQVIRFENEEQRKEIKKSIEDNKGIIISGNVKEDINDDNGYILFNQPLELDIESNQGARDFIYFSYNTLEDDEDKLHDEGFYIRFKHLLDFINTSIIFKIKGSNTPIITIDTSIEGNKMYTFPFQVSLDPRVCIVKNEIEPINSKRYYKSLPDWKHEDKGYSRIMNIYLNCNMITRILSEKQDEDGNVPIFEVIQSICTELNKALGGVNNLEPVVDEDTNTMKIIDASYSEGKPANDYVFELYGYDPSKNNQSNFVRNFNIKTEISSDFATMASVGSTAGGYVKGTENTMFSKWNRGLIDIFKEEYVAATAVSSNKDDKDPSVLYVQEFWNKRFAPFGLTAPQDIEDDSSNPDACAISGEIIDKNISTVTEFYKYCHSRIQKDIPYYASPTVGFIPINLSITCEGISGIKIYNSINVNTTFLPKNYPNSLKFIIKGVNHKISDNDWETTIETVTISQDEENGRKIVPYKKLLSMVRKIIYASQKTVAESSTLPPQIVKTGNETPLSYNGTSKEQNPLPTPAKSETNSKLEKATKEASIAIFKKYGAKAGLCGGYTYYIAEELARKLTKKPSFPGTGKGGNNAYAEQLRKNLSDLGIYTPGSLQPIATNVALASAVAKVDYVTSQANYGDVLIYYATPEPRGNKKGAYRFHAQIYTGNQYTGAPYNGKGWTTSVENNYKSSMVYASKSETPYMVYWFRIKDEYKDLPASNQVSITTPEDSAKAFNNLTYNLKLIYTLKDNFSNDGKPLFTNFKGSVNDDEEGAVKRLKTWFETDGPQFQYKNLNGDDKEAFNKSWYALLNNTKGATYVVIFESLKNKLVKQVTIDPNF
jgi:hypothetical protein